MTVQRDKRGEDAERRPGEEGQLEGRGHEPRDVRSPQKLEEAGRTLSGALDEGKGSEDPQHFDSGLLGLRTGRECSSVG